MSESPNRGKWRDLPAKQSSYKGNNNNTSAGYEPYANTNYPSPPQPASPSSTPAPPLASTSNKLQREKRIVMLLGKTGEGKSTLANVLTGTNNFEESDSSVSQTKGAQIETAEFDDISLQVVDTMGICDTSIPLQQVLTKIAHACYSVNSGVHQIIFAVGLRFTQELILIYELFQKVLFGADMAKYTTFVRTRFEGFANPARCEEDIRKMQQENPKLRAILQQSKIIHVNNPSVPSDPDDNIALQLSQRDRGRSREVMLSHLRQCRELYCPKPFREMLEIVAPHVIYEQQRLRAETTNCAKSSSEAQLNISITNYSTSNPSSSDTSSSPDSSDSSGSSGSSSSSSSSGSSRSSRTLRSRSSSRKYNPSSPSSKKYNTSAEAIAGLTQEKAPGLWDNLVNAFNKAWNWLGSLF